MPRKTTLNQLEEREAALLAKLEAERKTLRALQAKRAAAEKREQQQRWMAAGQLVEEAGLPLDLKELLAMILVYIPETERTHPLDRTPTNGTSPNEAQYPVSPEAKC